MLPPHLLQGQDVDMNDYEVKNMSMSYYMFNVVNLQLAWIYFSVT